MSRCRRRALEVDVEVADHDVAVVDVVVEVVVVVVDVAAHSRRCKKKLRYDDVETKLQSKTMHLAYVRGCHRRHRADVEDT